MKRKLLAIGSMILLTVGMAIPVFGQVVDATCNDVGFGPNLETSVSGEWGSIDFTVNDLTLTLEVEEGYEVEICVKAGSAQQGDGPEIFGPFGEGTYTISHSSLKELSHFGFTFDVVTTTTTQPDTTTTTDATTTTTEATTTTSEATTTTQATTTTTEATTTTTEGTTTTTEGTTTTIPGVEPFCVDVNTADQDELEELDGISPVLALAIIAGRPYESVQDLADILPPGGLALILIINADTGAFASDECLSSDQVTTTTVMATTIPGETTTTPPLTLGEIEAVCVSNIPFLSYNVDFPGVTALSSITFVNPDGPDVVHTNVPLTGSVIWPGANENPPDWPGWILQDNGIWVEGDDGFLWARETVTVIFEINPTATVQVDYPPASAICAGPVNPDQPGVPTTLRPNTPSPEDTFGTLPFTGAGQITLKSGIAASLIALGALLLLLSLAFGKGQPSSSSPSKRP